MNLTEEQVRAFAELNEPIRQRLETLIDAVDTGYRHDVTEFEIEGESVYVTVTEQQACRCCYEDATYNIPLEHLWREDGVELFKQQREEEEAEAKRKREERARVLAEDKAEQKRTADLETYERVKKELEGGSDAS